MNPVTMDLDEIERRTCEIASRQLGIPRDRVTPQSRLLADLHCDSLEAVELLMELEDEFAVMLRESPPDPIFKSVFARAELTLGDLAESIYLSQGVRGLVRRHEADARATSVPGWNTGELVAFTQLGGRWRPRAPVTGAALYEKLDCDPLDGGDAGRDRNACVDGMRSAGRLPRYRRRSDGMRCVIVPAAVVEIGSEAIEAEPDERPVHLASLDAFLLDMEPVSVTAFCRFLNSITPASEDLSAWIIPMPEDDRGVHVPVRRGLGESWEPVEGTAHLPMVMASWYGANAYTRWAHGVDWQSYRDDAPFLPSETQWEYAARGTAHRATHGGSAACELSAVHGRHVRGEHYENGVLPMSRVNERLGLSPWGMHHMAGNIWHWCRDWYDADFYRRPGATGRNPVALEVTGVRSERGGSWVGPAHLTRVSHRRGREPAARGRCLGFRGCAPVPADFA